MGVQMTLGPARLAWVSDIEPGPCQILAHHHPGVPNLGDMTAIDWTGVEPVDVITGGTPCQDLSTAGRRAGMKPGTRSGLWESMFHAVSIIRPHIVIWENVRGAYSADAFSLMEPDPGRVGDAAGRPVLRALGRVLGDLAGIGYDAQWVGVRASDVGAPHQRYRVFVTAHPQGDTWWLHHGDRGPTGDADSAARHQRRQSASGEAEGRGTWSDAGRPDRAPVTLLPTPRTENNENRQSEGYGPNLGGALLPTPVVNDMGDGKTLQWWDDWTQKMRDSHQNGNGHGPSLAIETKRLLPTPMVSDEKHPGPADLNRHAPQLRAAAAFNFGQYAPAIRRWEQATRPVPDPTEGGRLSPRFVEWMMGLPDGWVTDAPITRSQQLRALGNGVVPQQAAHALRLMRGRETTCQTAA
jgi:DNA (cytosine-5)-methyltransferase 1